MTNDNPFSYNDDQRSREISKNKPTIGVVTSTSTNKDSSNPPHSVRVNTANANNIEAEVIGVGGGDYYVPPTGTRVIVQQLSEGVWVIIGAEANPTAEDYAKDERIIGPAQVDSRLWFDRDGNVQLQSEENTITVGNGVYISTDNTTVAIDIAGIKFEFLDTVLNINDGIVEYQFENNTVMTDGEDNDIASRYQDEYESE